MNIYKILDNYANTHAIGSIGCVLIRINYILSRRIVYTFINSKLYKLLSFEVNRSYVRIKCFERIRKNFALRL